MRKINGSAFLSVCCLLAGVAAGAEVTMTGNVIPGAALGGLSATGSGSSGSPYTYTFTTTNGLSMAGYKFDSANASTKYMRLMMNGGSISGTRSAVNFTLNSVNSSGFASGLIVEQASTVDMGAVQTYADTANSSAGAVAIGTNTALGYIGDIRIAGISAYAESQCYDGAAGDVTIISTGSVNIVNSSDVPVGISAYGRGAANSGLRLGGNITVRHNGGLTAGDLNAYRQYSAAGAHRGGAGSVYLRGDYLGAGASGAFTARNIDVHTSSDSDNAGSITVTGYMSVAVSSLSSYRYNNNLLFGAGTGNGAGGAINLHSSGSITVGGNINSSFGPYPSLGNLTSDPSNLGGAAGSVSIYSSGGSVTITGAVDTTCADDDHSAGNLTITSYGPIALKNSINLGGTNAAYSGVLSLSTTGALTLASLDLSKVNSARLTFGAGSSVTGAVYGFATNYTTGSGKSADPFVTSQTKLRIAPGCRLAYYSTVATNAYLGGFAYRVADLSGNAGQGGILRVFAGSGTSIAIR